MYDVVIIGAGACGSATAMMLSKYKVKACVIERDEDVCCGTTKANSAIVHAGFDALPGTLKAKVNVEGNKMMEQLAKDLDFPFKRNGSLVVCTEEEGLPKLQELVDRANKNGVPGVRILSADEVKAMEPNLADEVVAALYAPTGGIVCPFNMNIAFAENAAVNGVEFKFNTKVTGIEKTEKGYTIETTAGKIETKAVVNAAGVYADELHNMVSEEKFEIIPRSGEYCLLDKTAGGHVSHTVFQLPNAMGKGVLVTPTVHGNLLVGPTATNLEDKEAINTTAEGLAFLQAKAGQSVKNIPLRQVITSFTGLRAHEKGDEFIIGEAKGAKGFYDELGIESPGLSSAPAIGQMVAEMIAKDMKLEKNEDYIGTRRGIINPQTLDMEERQKLIKANPAYGQIICRCEMISEGEIIDAIRRPLGARSLDGVKRRTRAGMGRCQAGFCSPRTMEILEREVPMSIYDVTKLGGESKIVFGTNKDKL